MSLSPIQRLLGMLILLFSFIVLAPAAVGLWYGDDHWQVFLHGFALLFVFGVAVWWPARRVRRDLHRRDGALLVVLFWVILGLAGAIPFLLSDNPGLGLTDAVFESVSGLTTTGATVIADPGSLPPSMLFYRQFLQWAGGMGIIVLAVAILPLLGIGGMQLYRSGAPAASKDTRITLRILETAKTLWVIYIVLTVACAVSYWLAGMSPFDAICMSFSTLSIGGFMTHAPGSGFFENVNFELVAIVFMLLAGANFALHFHAVRQRTLKHYFRDPEFRVYLSLLLWLSVFSSACLVFADQYPDMTTNIVHGVFHAVSIATTTGFVTGDYFNWPPILPVVLMLATFVGASANSTGGGMKVIRWILLVKQGYREVRRLIHPHGQFITKVGERAVPERVVSAVWGFFSVYVAVFAFFMLVTMAAGLDHVAAFSAVTACLNNVGPGLGDVSAGYAAVPAAAKWLLALVMIMGRLEILTLLILFTRAFWRR